MFDGNGEEKRLLRQEVVMGSRDVDAHEHDDKFGLMSPVRRRAAHGSRFIHIAGYSMLMMIIILQSLVLIHWRTELAQHPPKVSKLGLSTLRTQSRTSGLLNRFWDGDNLTEPNAAWHGINSGHGAIALEPSFARARNLPPTLAHPNDPDKVVYALEAYHLIHCIQVLRKDYLLIRDQKEPTKPLEHAMHCYDALRQSVMCAASDDLLIVTGHGHKNGFNQTRQCRDWDALRDFATQHTACYWDDELPEGQKDPWDMCDDGTDGLPVGNLLW